MDLLKLSKKNWEIFGKISAVLFAIVAFLTIISLLTPKKGPKINAKCNYGNFVLPPDMSEFISNLNMLSNYSMVQEIVISGLGENSEILKATIIDIANKVTDGFKEYFKENSTDLNKFNQYSEYLHLSIKNKGNKIAENIIVDFPINGIAIVTNEDGQKMEYQVENSIKNISIRPKKSISIDFWTTYLPLSTFNKDGLSISHGEGLGKVFLAKTSFGFYPNFIEFPLFYFVLILTILIILILFFVKEQLKPKKETQEN